MSATVATRGARRGTWRTDDGAIAFFGGPLSNFAGPAIVVSMPQPWSRREPVSQRYATVEHFFQASKALTETDHLWVAAAATPKEAKRRGRQVPLRADWESVKYAVMVTGLRAKFAPGSELGDRLAATGNAELQEASPYDAIWGTGRDGDGQNLLGKALMEVRAEIAAAAGLAVDGEPVRSRNRPHG